MVRFDYKIRVHATPGWEEAYIDYASLKRLLYADSSQDMPVDGHPQHTNFIAQLLHRTSFRKSNMQSMSVKKPSDTHATDSTASVDENISEMIKADVAKLQGEKASVYGSSISTLNNPILVRSGLSSSTANHVENGMATPSTTHAAAAIYELFLSSDRLPVLPSTGAHLPPSSGQSSMSKPIPNNGATMDNSPDMRQRMTSQAYDEAYHSLNFTRAARDYRFRRRFALEILKVEQFYRKKLVELTQQIELLESQAEATCKLGEEKRLAKKRALAQARQERRERELEARAAAAEARARLAASESNSAGPNPVDSTGLRNRHGNKANEDIDVANAESTVDTLAAATASRRQRREDHGDGYSTGDASAFSAHSIRDLSFQSGSVSYIDHVEQVDRDLLTIRQEHEYV